MRQMTRQGSVLLFVIPRLTLDTLVVKGAPDVLFPRCTSVLFPSGEVRSMTPDILKDLREQILINWSRNGQRVLMLAWRTLSAPDVEEKYLAAPDLSEDLLKELTSDLILVGMIGIVDPPRPDIPRVIQTCRGAGIKVVMVYLFLRPLLIDSGHWRLRTDRRSTRKRSWNHNGSSRSTALNPTSSTGCTISISNPSISR